MTRQRKYPVSNCSLAALLKRTGWTMSEAAKRINRTAAENGFRLTYGASAISHWLTGITPRPEAVPVIVETFASALHLPELTAAELGWPMPEHEVADSPWQGDMLTRLTALARSDLLDRQGSLGLVLYSVSHLSAPPPRMASQPVDRATFADHRFKDPDVLRVRKSARELLRLFELFGGAYIRPASGSFLLNDAVPLLRAATDRKRPELLRAVSEIVHVLGMIAADAGSLGRSQQYYILALRLAYEAGDLTARSLLCFQLAEQAIQANHLLEAESLADAGMHDGPAEKHPALQAASASLRALAYARAGNRREALAALAIARQKSEKAGSAAALNWVTGSFSKDFSHVSGRVLMAIGDLGEAASHLSNALSERSDDECLSRSLIGVRLARVLTHMGRTKDAVARLRMVGDDLHAVLSVQVQTELSALHSSWRNAADLVSIGSCQRPVGTVPLWPIRSTTEPGRRLL
jgi:tetratricopeptide (TPR) repeat protein